MVTENSGIFWRTLGIMADADLVHLISLSLGVEPKGVVNFNYLHTLLHEIVRRLVEFESVRGSPPPRAAPSVSKIRNQSKSGDRAAAGKTSDKKDEGVEKEGSEAEVGDLIPGGADATDEGEDGERALPTKESVDGKRSRIQSKASLAMRPSLAMAANDVDALNRKLLDIELRLNTVESLPEMLEEKASNAGATPVSDLWNFAIIDSRMRGTENNMAKVSKVVDDLLGEFQNLRKYVEDSGEQMTSELESIQTKLLDLESLKLAAVKDSMGDTAAAMLKEMQDKLEKIQADTQALKDQKFVTMTELEVALAKAMKDHRATLQSHESTIQAQGQSLMGLEKALMESSQSAEKLAAQVGGVENELRKLMDSLGDIETSLKSKVDVDNLASFIPQGGDDQSSASLIMPKLVELQNKLNLLESKLGGLPPDMIDQIDTMKKSIETLTDELSSLSALINSLQSKRLSDDTGNLEDLSRQVAQLRERMSELDRAISALSNLVASNAQQEEQEEPDGTKYVDEEAFAAVQNLLAQLQQENERLLGTAAHLSHELEVNTQHVKSLHGGVEDLKTTKADKAHLEVQVREKADRRALDEKASKNWVKSTFDVLDRQIREAMARMIEREEAVKMVSDLNDNVEGKVDRIELQPFKDYVEKKLRVKELPKIEVSKELADEAAGFKKPLRFSCLSCDKPVGLKPLGAIPALPSINVFPGTRSFRPYTTFELELIRRHQKAGYPIPIQTMDMHHHPRTAGGHHTVTHAYRRSRMVPGPFSTATHTPDTFYRTNGQYANSSLAAHHFEANIVGADGHVYKGRVSRDDKPKTGPGRLLHRPTSSPAPTHNY